MSEELNKIIESEKSEENKRYKKQWWKQKGTRYKRITSTYSDEDFQLIEQIADKLKRRPSEIVSLACMQALKQEQTSFTSKDEEQAKLALVKETLVTLNRIGTNVNQIARDLNERRLMDRFNHNLTRDEKNKMLQLTAQLEYMLLSLQNNHTEDDY